MTMGKQRKEILTDDDHHHHDDDAFLDDVISDVFNFLTDDYDFVDEVTINNREKIDENSNRLTNAFSRYLGYPQAQFYQSIQEQIIILDNKMLPFYDFINNEYDNINNAEEIESLVNDFKSDFHSMSLLLEQIKFKTANSKEKTGWRNNSR